MKAFVLDSAVAARHLVTVHENPVSIPGWTGTGYMVINETTGDSAFMIGGGGNGGWLNVEDGLNMAIAVFGLVMIHASGALFIVALIATIVYTAILTWHIAGLLDDCPGMSMLSKWMATAFFAVGVTLKLSGLVIIAAVISYWFGGTLNMAHDVCREL